VATTNPLSRRSRAKTFTGEEVAAFVERQTTRLAKSKKARVVRKAEDFDAAKLAAFMRAPVAGSSDGGTWSIADIYAARDAQMAGNFRLPAKLAKAIGTDGAIFTSRLARLAPVQSLTVQIEPGKGPKAAKIAEEAEALFGEHGIAISPATETSLRLALVDHGIAIAVINKSPRDDGSRVDMTVAAWPMAWVRWDPTRDCYVTQVQELDEEPEAGARLFAATVGFEEPIVHGNGRWIVFAKSEIEPHTLDAAILPAAMIWPRRAFALRDWAKGSAVHGNVKVVGELPEGDPLTDELGEPSQQAVAFRTLLEAIASQNAPFGIRPSGSKIDLLANPSGAWEVFAKLTEVSERDAARIYLGTDGVLGAQGGAPGVDISLLMGVASTKIQSDLTCMAGAFQSGIIAYWCAINFGDDKAAPTRRYIFPDPDEMRVREDFMKRHAAFLAAVEKSKSLGFVIDEKTLGELAAEYKVTAPTLPAATDAAKPSIALAPTDIARVVSVNEARASAGLGPRAADGELTVEQFAAKIAAQNAAAVAESNPVPTATPAE
jgi:hypothetical protein